MTTIKIKGTIPTFDQNELERRQQAYKHWYLNTRECKEIARGELPFRFLQTVIKMSGDGYVLDEKLPIRMESLNYSAYMTKPQHIQDIELAQKFGKVKEDYIFHLKAERELFKELLKSQLIEKDEIKEADAIASAKAKRLLEIESEVNSTFTELVIPE
ncbi:hypothetical protein [Pseudomonas violetae]|uniref:Uncharacterized protein n=1 Tax=Pseudomonas violetae TaxID=2915813 RepID=A0ABT0EVL8_9PSED|nr:hypothetical protein [Pseudomonas violetae]MCK1789745.1 hypothetical protein [Pseudomonas violetae]